MVQEHYLEEDGEICFLLKPREDLFGLLPESARKEAMDPESPGTVEFYALLDARDMSWSFPVIMHEIGKEQISDLLLELPESLKNGLVAEMEAWFRESQGKELRDAAEEHRAFCLPDSPSP